jgi:hypothetical protein
MIVCLIHNITSYVVIQSEKIMKGAGAGTYVHTGSLEFGIAATSTTRIYVVELLSASEGKYYASK